jgi:hypothetical protein
VISGAKVLIAGSSNFRENNSDVYVAKLDSNGVAYTTTAPTISASGPLSFCAGGSVILKVPSGYTRYSWGKTLSNQLSYMNVDNDSLVVTTSGSYFCTLWNSGGMRTTAMVYVTVTPQTVASITPSGSTSFCAADGQSVTLTAPSGFTSYQWSLNGNSISGAIQSSYSPVSSGTYTVSVSNICGASVSSPVLINNASPPAVSLTCNSSTCFSGSGSCLSAPGSLQATSISGATYNWFVDNALLVSGTNILYPPYPAGDYFCSVTTTCGTTTTNLLSVVDGGIYGGNAIEYFNSVNGCGIGSSVVLSAPSFSAPPYQWYLNGSPIALANSNSYTATQSGYYIVDFYDPYCVGPNTSTTLQVTLNTTNPAISAPGGTSSCSGGLQLSATPVGANMFYTWYNGNSIVSSGTSPTITVNTTGTYKCYVFNPACGSKFTGDININIGNPVATATIQNTTICSGATSLLSCSPQLSGVYSYQWRRNGTPISGAISSSYSASLAGAYTCAVTNSCSTVVSNVVSLTVNPVPTATIQPRHPLLFVLHYH